MQLTHKIALCPMPEHADDFRRACGTARDRLLDTLSAAPDDAAHGLFWLLD
jgi:hypothetical protein